MKKLPIALLALLSVGAPSMAFADIPWHGFAFGDDSSPHALYNISELLAPTPKEGWGVQDHNANGQSLVSIQATHGDIHSALTALSDNGTLTPLFGLAWQGRGIATTSWGVGVNARGDVIGQTHIYDREGDTPVAAWVLNNGRYYGIARIGETYATALNNMGQVVGNTCINDFADEGRGPTAFLWQNGAMYNLDLLEDAASQNWLLDTAAGIDDKGDIIGMGRFGENGPEVGFLAVPDIPTTPNVTAVPEPAAYALMLAGLVPLLSIKRRR